MAGEAEALDANAASNAALLEHVAALRWAAAPSSRERPNRESAARQHGNGEARFRDN